MAGVRQFDEEQVLGRALEVFRRKGLVATSMLDLAEGTGVQRGSLYNAYGDKDTIFLLAYERYTAGYLDNVRKALAHSDPRQALTAFFKVVIDTMAQGSPSLGCLTTKTVTESVHLRRSIKQRLRQFLDDLSAVMTAALSTEAARESLNVEPERAAQVIVTFIRGLAVMERAYQDPQRLTEVAQAFVDTFFPSKKGVKRAKR